MDFHETKDLAVRAETCMACHVGGDRAEVNHDLLAAGHPPLQFEFSSFLDRYRAYQHWSEADDRRRDPAYEATAWAVGQAASARAALRLLTVRVEASDPKLPDAKPWPEFSEYACSSCHHDLKAQPRTVAVGHAPGLPAWSWYTAMTPLLPEALPSGADRDLVGLKTLMETRIPNPSGVAANASALIASYDAWLKDRPTDPTGPAKLRGQLSLLTGPAGETAARGGWEDARQLSLAISAYSRSLEAVEPDARTAAAVHRLDERLRLPYGQDTPRNYDAERAVQDLRDLHDLLNHR